MVGSATFSGWPRPSAGCPWLSRPIRKPDGGFAIATFPTLTADPTWSVESIDELVRQTWDDPHLAGGSVLVRSGRVLKGMWTGQGHHIKLAAAALSDPEAPDHPWGLLCVAEPLTGHFEQDQLNLLGNLASRLTSYLRARQQVLEGSLAFGQSDAVATPVAEHLSPNRMSPWSRPRSSPVPPPRRRPLLHPSSASRLSRVRSTTSSASSMTSTRSTGRPRVRTLGQRLGGGTTAQPGRRLGVPRPRGDRVGRSGAAHARA